MSSEDSATAHVLRYLLGVALLALVYYAAARFGLAYASIGESVSLIWPPTGIAFGTLTLLGFRYWPGVTAGAFLANAATAVPLWAAGSIAAGNTLEAVVAAFLLGRLSGGKPQLDNLRHVRALILAAAPLGALCSAVVGASTLSAAGALSNTGVFETLAVWWIGDLLGALVVGPVILTWGTPAQQDGGTRGLREAVVLAVGTLIVAELALGYVVDPRVLRQVEYHYLLFPFVIWAALRFGPRGATLMTLSVATVAVIHTVRGGGPFIAGTSTNTLFAVAAYLAAVAITGLVLAAAVQLERRVATRALAHSEERLRRALDAARMGTWVWSVDDNNLVWDENLRRIYGLRPDERVSTYQDFLGRIHPEDRAFVADSVRRVLEEGGGDLDYQFRIVLPDGSIRWIADQGEVRRNAEGRPFYLAGVCADVTDRRMTEERLRQAHRMESVGRLAGGVAHEANNQMSVVMGAAEFILRRPDIPEAVRVDVEFIQKAAERTAAVTGQLLAFSRRQVLRPEMLDLNELVRRWEPVVRRIMGEDCTVRLQLGTGLGLVRADPGQLEQVLLNLALNARDAMPRGGTITIETFSTELTAGYGRLKPGISVRSGRYAVVAVSDTGHGMDKATLSHIFEPFFTTKGLGKGTGLGLSTVYGIVKQSDGYIWAYSEPGQGTTFKLYFPGRTGELAPNKKSETGQVSRRGERILLVEDEASVRSVMKRALEEAGYRVLEASNAKEGIARLLETDDTVDLILTDVVMPGGTGRELAEQIAELRPGIPVLFTSGYTDGDIQRRGLLDPGAAFIQKPVTPDALVRAVEQQLRGRADGLLDGGGRHSD
ncbi:MAG TPA: MASE1 domain-containing protein [Gemmatimonadales bacterium]|nr:MASE1 domain-containing protein [Gemmatimonadales bacterium]